MSKIIPGVLEDSWQEIEKKIETAKLLSDTIHIDIIDGVFAQTQSFLDPQPFSKFADDITLEAHLMVKDPLKFLEPFANAGFRRFIGHIEKMENLEEFVARGQLLGEVGLALDIDTEVDTLKLNLEDLDCLLLMGTKAGASGQNLDEKVLGKLKSLRQKTFIPLEIDGGVNDSNILNLQEAGADRFVTTSFLFGKDPLEAYKKLTDLLEVK
jgi:ribulose-phosphate 3-epimerase